jgi:cytoskeletal protein RodZ
MKEISEDMQMMIFDLLEGNLNKHEEINLLKQIEEQPNLKAEYQLMKLTYLTLESESINSDFKQSLLKKTPILWFKPVIIGRAAAILLLFGVGSYGVFRKFNQPVSPGEMVKNEVNTNENAILESLNEVNLPKDKDFQRLAQVQDLSPKSNFKTRTINEVKTRAKSQVFEKSVAVSMKIDENKTGANIDHNVFQKTHKEAATLPNNNIPIIAASLKREAPLEIIIIEENDMSTSNMSQNTEQDGFLTRLVNSTKNSLKHGQTPDINLNFNRSNFKIALGIDNHDK